MYYEILEQTWEEKFKMYRKLSKKELITMLIEANRILTKKLLEYYHTDTVLYNEICSCNPKNGGSGICGCTMANQEIPYTR